jgi:hypothetical protein
LQPLLLLLLLLLLLFRTSKTRLRWIACWPAHPLAAWLSLMMCQALSHS